MNWQADLLIRARQKALGWNNKKVAGRATGNKDNTHFDYLIDCGGVLADNLS